MKSTLKPVIIEVRHANNVALIINSSLYKLFFSEGRSSSTSSKSELHFETMIEALVDSSAGMGILAIIAIVIVTQFLRHSLQSSSAKIPIIGDAKANDFRSALKEGWTKVC